MKAKNLTSGYIFWNKLLSMKFQIFFSKWPARALIDSPPPPVLQTCSTWNTVLNATSLISLINDWSIYTSYVITDCSKLQFSWTGILFERSSVVPKAFGNHKHFNATFSKFSLSFINIHEEITSLIALVAL